MKLPTTIRRLAIVAAACAGIAGMALVMGYRATKSVPEFYAEQMLAPPASRATAGSQLELQIVDLHNALQTDGDWKVAVTDDQINGWLAVELQRKFPGALPGYASEPRVKIDEDGALVACQYDNGRLSAVLSMAVDAFVTDQPNEIGIRIHDARVGSVPGLTAEAVEQLSWAARRARLRFRWLQEEGDPVAMVELPRQILDTDNDVTVTGIQWHEGQLLLTGSTRRRLPEAPVIPATAEQDIAAPAEARPAVHVAHRPIVVLPLATE